MDLGTATVTVVLMIDLSALLVKPGVCIGTVWIESIVS
jgi:hypothetical protein